MHSSVINFFTLCLAVVSVVARGVPERRNVELQARAVAGGYGFGNPLQKMDSAVDKTEVSAVKVESLAATSELDALIARMQAMGLEKLSEGMLGDSVHTGTYAIPADTTISKRLSSPLFDLEKRADVNIEGATCLTACGFDTGVQHANPDDCKIVYNTLFGKATRFSLNARTVTYYVYQQCAGFLINNTANTTAVYDFWDYGGSTMWLNGKCVMGESAAIGTCIFKDAFGSAYESSVYISVNHPSYFGL